MSLYTDSDLITEADLVDIDSEIRDVAAASNISIDAKIREAWEETGSAILAKMEAFGGSVNILVGAGVQMATLLTNYGMGVARSRVWLSQIIADESYAGMTSPLKRWLAYEALPRFYRDASERVNADRYDRKRDRFEQDAKLSAGRLKQRGLPLVLQPLPAPGALHEMNSGTFGEANLSQAAAVGLTGGNFAVAITWVDSSKYVSSSMKGNGESGPSTPAGINVAADNAIAVSIASLNPPNGKPYQSGTFADGILAMLTATHWNIYAGNVSETLTLQNATPIPVGTKTYTLPSDPTSSGAFLAPGQTPDARYAFLNVVQRA